MLPAEGGRHSACSGCCSRFPLDRMHRVRARQALEPELARIAERHVAGALGELLQRRGDEDLAAARLRRDASGEHDVAAEEVVALADRPAGAARGAGSRRWGPKKSPPPGIASRVCSPIRTSIGSAPPLSMRAARAR